MQFPIDDPVFYDLEVFPNWFEAGFRFSNGEVRQYVIPLGDTYGHADLLIQLVMWLRQNNIPLVGFNSNGYDDPVLTTFIKTKDPRAAYAVSVSIIVEGAKPWTLDNDINSIDLMPILPGRMSLKKIGVCLGHSRLQELPIAYDKTPNAEEQGILLGYNGNDLHITEKLYHAIYDEIALRHTLSLQYGIDLRSKGEAGLAETILLYERGQRGYDNSKRKLNERAWQINGIDVTVFEPHWWKPLVVGKLPVVEEVGTEIFNSTIPLGVDGRLARGAMDQTVFIEDRYYAMGVGGLHSVDGPGAWEPAPDEVLFDIDVASYYPNIVLTNGLYPRQWGEVFLEIYKDIVDRRLKAKREGDKTTAAVLKIAANGTYGKSSDIYSSLYDPQLTANVTLLGQLGLLTLIEMLVGTANVCSANTDGITVLCKRSLEGKLREIVGRWEMETGLEMEYTEYAGLYQRDVNSYVAVKVDGKAKSKGAFIDQWPDLRHTPSANIVATAVKEYLVNKTPVLQTIKGCTDLNQFVLTQVVTGNTKTEWNHRPLGKILRFYKSSRQDSAPILRTDEGGKVSIVADSEGCVPVEDLPESFPVDLNISWYTKRAIEAIETISHPKVMGMNKWAEIMVEAGMKPCIVDPNAKQLGRAQVEYGKVDFASIRSKESIGVKTGNGVVAQMFADGRTEFYRTTKLYPSKSRPKVLADHGFTLVYGARVEHTGVVWLKPERDWDSYYTEAELRKVGR